MVRHPPGLLHMIKRVIFSLSPPTHLLVRQTGAELLAETAATPTNQLYYIAPRGRATAGVEAMVLDLSSITLPA